MKFYLKLTYKDSVIHIKFDKRTKTQPMTIYEVDGDTADWNVEYVKPSRVIRIAPNGRPPVELRFNTYTLKFEIVSPDNEIIASAFENEYELPNVMEQDISDVYDPPAPPAPAPAVDPRERMLMRLEAANAAMRQRLEAFEADLARERQRLAQDRERLMAEHKAIFDELRAM
jgi:hypothetical protein